MPLFKKQGDNLLLIAVNTIGTYVEALIRFDHVQAESCTEVFSGRCYSMGKQGLRIQCNPYEAKAFLFPRPYNKG